MHSLVLLSGGLDSAVLAAQEARTLSSIQCMSPAVSRGRRASSASSQRLLSAPPFSNGSTGPCRWRASSSACAMCTPPRTGRFAGTPPAYDTPDEDVYLHGRNIALLSKAAVYAASRSISRIVVAPLAGNPFPDATPQFFSALNTAFSHRARCADRRSTRRSPTCTKRMW